MIENYYFDEKSNEVINYAFVEARELGRKFVGTEHLLLGVIGMKETRISKIFSTYSIDELDIKLELIRMIGRGAYNDKVEAYSQRSKKCLAKANEMAMNYNNGEIMPEHIFMSIVNDRYSMAYKLLFNMNIEIDSLLDGNIELGIQEKSSVIKRDKHMGREIKSISEFDILEAFSEEKFVGGKNSGQKSKKTNRETSIIDEITIDLTTLAEENQLDEVVGREEELNRLIQILSRKNKNNPCIIGEAGIGKTSLVNKLANSIVNGNVPTTLQNKRILLVNLGMLLQGTMYRGQFEEKMMDFIKEIVDNTTYIVFFDEIHNLVGAGSTGDKSLDAIGILKPYLSRNGIQFIGTTNYKEYNLHITKNQSFERFLVPVYMEEASKDETIDILKKLKINLQKHHDVIILDGAIEMAVKLASRYLTERFFPDKAIDIIDEAASIARIDRPNEKKEGDGLRERLENIRVEKENSILKSDEVRVKKLSEEEKEIELKWKKNVKTRIERPLVDEDRIKAVVSSWSKLPVEKLSIKEKENLIAFEENVKKRLIGQDKAVKTVANSLKRSRIGIKSENSPMGVFLLVGPTGTGKTELGKAVANVYFGDEKSIIRFDMSEYMEPHSVSKLIGSPPGYEGHDDGGLLSKAVKKNPFSLVVFDEIEKAHRDVLNILLQVMDEGYISDSKGRFVSFRDTLIMMTSNIGSHETVLEKRMGFGERLEDKQYLKLQEITQREIKKYLNPEFINRIDEIVIFQYLGEKELLKILEIQLKDLEDILSSKNVFIKYNEEVLKFIIGKNKEYGYGARPLKRIIHREIVDKLADILLTNNDFESKKISLKLTIENEELKIREELQN